MEKVSISLVVHMQIIDHTKQLDIMLEAYKNREKYKQNLQKSNQKVEIIKKDYGEMDGYSFAVVKVNVEI
ncbi:hypothetical protein [Sulfuracidifex metallicus]|uniref:hypothetical protein n=1 Tax=Sulfuracidifex metallicus TaxID=47303 RepID=UPI0006D1C07B|nr:hypothetical protein [Sulfuracidifex metallicus]